MKWAVSIFHYEGKDYVGIDETESEKGMTQEKAERACIRYAKKHNLPLFLSFRWESSDYVKAEKPC